MSFLHLPLRSLSLAVAFAIGLAACDTADPIDSVVTEASVPVATAMAAGKGPIENQYIVIFKDEVPGGARLGQTAQRAAAAVGGRVKFTYGTALKGFAVEASAAAARALAARPDVKEVVPDEMFYPTATQSNAPYNLDRVDQRSLPLNKTYSYGPTGQGVTVYVIDSGIRATHTQFGGRAALAVDVVGDGRNGQDCNGHGTHVAGTVAGSTYGAAKAVQVRSVRVFGCSGGSAASTIIAGIDWVAANAQRPAVANLSLGGPSNSAIDLAVTNLIRGGITAAVAAGNDYNADACARSPARVSTALTVGATNASDQRADFSNSGTCLDVWAPGTGIVSAGISTDASTATMNGTSMATPLVAAAAALYLQGDPGATPATVAAALSSRATMNVVSGGGSAPNRLLFTSPPPPPPSLPAPSLTSTYDKNLYIRLNWTAVSGAVSYAVERTNTGYRGTMDDGVTILGAVTTTDDYPYNAPDFTSFAPNQFFGFACYQIIATGSEGQRSSSNTVCYGVNKAGGGF